MIIRPWFFLLWAHFSPANSLGTCPSIVWPPIFLSKLPEGEPRAHASLCLHLPYCPGSRLILDIIMEADSSWGFSLRASSAAETVLSFVLRIWDGESVHLVSSLISTHLAPRSLYGNKPSFRGCYCGDEVAAIRPEKLQVASWRPWGQVQLSRCTLFDEYLRKS